MKAGNLLAVDKLTVYGDRIVAQISVNLTRSYTTPELAQRVLESFPHLPLHTCINEKGPTFAAVIEHTPIPHLYEHLVVDILSREQAPEAVGENTSALENLKEGLVVGTSEWVDRKAGTARVEVSYADDLVALAAFKEAEEFLNNMTA